MPEPTRYESYIYHKPVEKGRVEQITGTIFYEKKEAGWTPVQYIVKLKNPTVE